MADRSFQTFGLSADERQTRAMIETTLPTVLLVDDDTGVRVLLYQILEEAGYNVLVACNGTDALVICRQFRHPIALLLTDVQMPGMSGFELADEARRIRPLIRVLFMSGNATQQVGRDSEILAKPFGTAALMRNIRLSLQN